jgi:tRNA/tmRNA/rRNA uracil-C5-methylase (TrmA/RlmC/RlmD family)
MGRISYPTALAEALATALQLDGSGRLLDVGCGPGNFTLLMAPWFHQATGVDADRDMLTEAERQAAAAGIGNVEWLHLRAEEIAIKLWLASFHSPPQHRICSANDAERSKLIFDTYRARSTRMGCSASRRVKSRLTFGGRSDDIRGAAC